MAKDLAMQYSIQKKNKKKYAKGGQIPPSAKDEKRPMPGEKNDSGKAPKNDQVLDQPTKAQAQKPSKTPLSRPKIASSGVFGVNDVDPMADMKPASPKQQPSQGMNEKGANRHGPGVHKMKRMAEGGMMPMGAEDDQAEHPAGLESDNDQIRPPSKEYMSGLMAGMHHAMAEGGTVKSDLDKAQAQAADEQGRMDADHEAQEEAKRKPHTPPKAEMIADDDMMAEGGEVAPEDYSDKPDKGYGKIIFKAEGGKISPMDEEEAEHESSIAAAIMAKRDKKMMAEGGEVDLEANNEEGPADADDLIAGKKEDYQDADLSQPEDSNEMGDEREDAEEDKHDMVGSIRKKMNVKRQFSK